MTKWKTKVYRVGVSKEPIYEGGFEGTGLAADNHLSDLWSKYTPADGTGHRATLREVGDHQLRTVIGSQASDGALEPAPP
ncbi:hypothetical protein [Ciceribacter sp. RN22]|uniref:hypothetical protein n=1 Tax=Ciceribacter sp. RN22 TaxID=2954932 RepID=UPI00209241FD|nr:hypothetical protein [Ciceribacter sp. RN22]MCO6180782.1 hypothetical protein [Ciceribacter sp. RN22]